MPAITVCLITARVDHPIPSLPGWHVVDSLARDLERQTFRDFELVVADVLYDRRPGSYDWPVDGLNYRFPVRHVRPRANPWHARRKAAIPSTRNAAFDHGSGELYVWFGDCCSVPPHYLERVWWWYERHGYFADYLMRIMGEESLVHDPREAAIPEGVDHLRDVDAYGGCMSRPAYEKTGGYESLMDACWGCEDGEMSARLRQAGYHTVVERGLNVYLPRQTVGYDCFEPVCHTLCAVTMLKVKHERILRGEIMAGVPLTEAERGAFLPQCRHLVDGDRCSAYPGLPACTQPSRRPDPSDPNVRLALGLPAIGEHVP